MRSCSMQGVNANNVEAALPITTVSRSDYDADKISC